MPLCLMGYPTSVIFVKIQKRLMTSRFKYTVCKFLCKEFFVHSWVWMIFNQYSIRFIWPFGSHKTCLIGLYRPICFLCFMTSFFKFHYEIYNTIEIKWHFFLTFMRNFSIEKWMRHKTELYLGAPPQAKLVLCWDNLVLKQIYEN